MTILWYFGNSIVEFMWEDIPYPVRWKRLWKLSIYKGTYPSGKRSRFTLWVHHCKFVRSHLVTICFFLLLFGFKWDIRWRRR